MTSKSEMEMDIVFDLGNINVDVHICPVQSKIRKGGFHFWHQGWVGFELLNEEPDCEKPTNQNKSNETTQTIS